ncbi:CHD3-type chromatin-remodeling factor PICKLE-like [Forsythia ovata]|uniref:CHD3-type chromatin-remodeling factor PICKLE-like n=1 Tax=Forsythia ovata TaxID=205694 RepID=A0ABD1W6E6_9LAMI
MTEQARGQPKDEEEFEVHVLTASQSCTLSDQRNSRHHQSIDLIGEREHRPIRSVNVFDRLGDEADSYQRKTHRFEGRKVESVLLKSLLNLEALDNDGVPKEGLRIQDVLVRIAVLLLIRDKVRATSVVGSTLFADDIVSRYPALKSIRHWKEDHDKVLLQAVLNFWRDGVSRMLGWSGKPGKSLAADVDSWYEGVLSRHGYGRWQAIVDDKDLRIQEVICQELNLAFIDLPVSGAPQAQKSALGSSQVQYPSSGASQAQVSASGVPHAHGLSPEFSQSQNGVNSDHVEAPGNQTKEINSGNDLEGEVAHGTTDTATPTQVFQDQSMQYHFREMQRKLVEFVKKRLLLLEKGLNAEYQKDDENPNEIPDDETGAKVAGMPNPSLEELDTQMIDQLPLVEMISPDGISLVVCDNESDRLDMARLYNEICKVVMENAQDAEAAYMANRPTSLKTRTNLAALESFNQEINQILSGSPPQDKQSPKDDKPEVEQQSSSSMPVGDNSVSAMDADTPTECNITKPNLGREINNPPGNLRMPESCPTVRPKCSSNGSGDIEMDEKLEDNYDPDTNTPIH